MNTFDLVIFDCDGVLVDSEVITNGVFAQMLGELGMGVTVDWMFEHCVGHSMAYCRAVVRELLGSELPPGFDGDYRERAARALAGGLCAVPGIHAGRTSPRRLLDAGAASVFGDMRELPAIIARLRAPG